MEGLRGFAVTLVFLQHYSRQSLLLDLSPGAAHVFAAAFRHYGNLGVELFFVLSGYLIYGHLVKRAPPFGRFMARRVQRIYPAFLCVLAMATAALILVGPSARFPQSPWQGALYLAENVALLPGLFPIVPIVAVAWTLSYEMFFYLAAGVVVLGAKMDKMSRDTRLLIIAAISCAFFAAAFTHIPDFPMRMMPFFAGMLIAEGVGQRIPAWLGLAAPIASFLVSSGNLLPPVWAEFFHTVAFFLLCAVCFRGIGLVSAWMRWAPIRWLGNMSYSFYLVHGFVVRAGMLLIAKVLAAPMPAWLFWALLPALYAAALGCSAVLFVAVEKPISLQSKPRGTPNPASALSADRHLQPRRDFSQRTTLSGWLAAYLNCVAVILRSMF